MREVKQPEAWYTPIRRGSLSWASPDIIDCVMNGNSTSYSADPPDFDHLIYLDGNGCSDEMAIGLTLTFAHELQHFIQHCNKLDLWAANAMISTLCDRLCNSDVRALNLKSFQVPIEEEARIVSKRTAENIFGPEIVEAYITKKVSEAHARFDDNDAADWSFVLGLPVLGSLGAELPDTSTLYDLASNTKRIYRQRLRNHRSQLASVLQEFRAMPGHSSDFRNVDLEALFDDQPNERRV